MTTAAPSPGAPNPSNAGCCNKVGYILAGPDSFDCICGPGYAGTPPQGQSCVDLSQLQGCTKEFPIEYIAAAAGGALLLICIAGFLCWKYGLCKRRKIPTSSMSPMPSPIPSVHSVPHTPSHANRTQLERIEHSPYGGHDRIPSTPSLPTIAHHRRAGSSGEQVSHQRGGSSLSRDVRVLDLPIGGSKELGATFYSDREEARSQRFYSSHPERERDEEPVSQSHQRLGSTPASRERKDESPHSHQRMGSSTPPSTQTANEVVGAHFFSIDHSAPFYDSREPRAHRRIGSGTWPPSQAREKAEREREGGSGHQFYSGRSFVRDDQKFASSRSQERESRRSPSSKNSHHQREHSKEPPESAPSHRMSPGLNPLPTLSVEVHYQQRRVSAGMSSSSSAPVLGQARASPPPSPRNSHNQSEEFVLAFPLAHQRVSSGLSPPSSAPPLERSSQSAPTLPRVISSSSLPKLGNPPSPLRTPSGNLAHRGVSHLSPLQLNVEGANLLLPSDARGSPPTTPTRRKPSYEKNLGIPGTLEIKIPASRQPSPSRTPSSSASPRPSPPPTPTPTPPPSGKIPYSFAKLGLQSRHESQDQLGPPRPGTPSIQAVEPPRSPGPETRTPISRDETPPPTDITLFVNGKNEYTVLKLLGQGHFGKAFLVLNERSQRLMVLKAQLCENDSKKNEIVREAAYLSRFGGTNLLKFEDLFIQGMYVCIVMNYCSGGSLAEEVEKPHSVAEVIRILQEVCAGLLLLHSQDHVHRDIKPDNVFFSDAVSRTVIIGDLGLARHIGDRGFYASSYGHALYKAPEVHYGKFSTRADMWAVGCVGLELLSHQSMLELYKRGIILGLLSQNDLTNCIDTLLGPILHEPICELVRCLLVTDPTHRLSARDVIEWRGGHLIADPYDETAG